jgi:hypothetical protein
VLGYESTVTTNTSDANWLVCKVRFALGPSYGEVDSTFTTEDFVRFDQELRALLEGERLTAAFET